MARSVQMPMSKPSLVVKKNITQTAASIHILTKQLNGFRRFRSSSSSVSSLMVCRQIGGTQRSARLVRGFISWSLSHLAEVEARIDS
jgi:hypothetical protein